MKAVLTACQTRSHPSPLPTAQQLHPFAHHLQTSSKGGLLLWIFQTRSPLGSEDLGPSAGVPVLLENKRTVGESGVQFAGQTSPWTSTNWNALTRRRVSSTLRPTGRSFTLKCLMTPLGSIMKRPLRQNWSPLVSHQYQN